jgi:peptidoglycan hydrolase-like protein with peptidoglycan-binding domain
LSKHVSLAALITGGLLTVAAGCGVASDAVVVLGPANQSPPAARAARAVPVTTAATTTVPPTTLPPTTTTTIAPGLVPQPVPALAAPLEPSRQGRSGPGVKAIEDRLLQLGFWLDAADGQYTAVTSQAVMAFQKDQGLERTGKADQVTVDRLVMAKRRVMAKSLRGNLMEVDKEKQLLYVIRGGKVVWAVNTSTGSGKSYVERNKNTGDIVRGDSITPDGLHKVYRQHTVGWRKGDLGQIYRPKYFIGGAAVHGAPKIPGYPASHGCVRVTTRFMDFVYENDFMPMGSFVWVHSGGNAAQPPLT